MARPSLISRRLVPLIVIGAWGCTAEVPVICHEQMDCPQGYTCTQNECVRSTDMSVDMDMSACSDVTSCGDGGGDLGDAGARGDALDLEPMCTAASVKLTCTDPAKPVCNTSNVCALCAGDSDDSQCNAHMNGKPRCDSVSGTCVACR